MRTETVRHIFFFTLLVLTTLAFLGLIRDFLQPVFWAAVLAVIFHPVQRHWMEVTGGRIMASILTMITIILIVLVPLFLVGAALTQESLAIYNQLVQGQLDLREPIRVVEEQAPIVAEYLDRFGVDFDQIKDGLSNAAVASSQFLATRALNFGQDVLRFGIMLFVMLYVLFFFLRDGEKLVDSLIRVLPLGDARERRLLEKFAEVSRATIKGTLVIGILQGALGGLTFWALGLAAPVLWGVVMAVLSFLPAVGAALVWAPAAVILIVSGQLIRGLILIAIGSVVISLVDNILRPILVGRDTQMPDFLILLSTLGGLAIFGISGIVIGPIIAAFFLIVWEMFGEEYAREGEFVADDETVTTTGPRPSSEDNGTPGDESAEPAPEPPTSTTTSTG